MAKPQDKKVLVVDDEEDVVFFLCTALEDAGFRADGAFSVDEALAKVKASPPDCISLDMVMPGKSGIILFHELRRRPEWSKIPVLFVTAHAREETVRRELDAAAALATRALSGPATYLEKPVTAELFVDAVASALHVELEPEGENPEASESSLREEIHDLLRGADAEALRKALRVLREAKPE